MPVITVQAGKLTEEQKRELIAQLTEVTAGIIKVPKQFFTVYVQEYENDSIGVGGEVLADLKAKVNK